MTILHILTYSWENGGASKVVHDLAVFQKKVGHTPVIISIDKKGDKLFKEIDGVEIIRITAPLLSRFFPLFSIDLFKILKTRPFDIYHLHGLWNFTLFAAHILKFWDKTIVTIHGCANPYTFINNKTKRLVFSILFQHKFLKKVNSIHVFHPQEKKFMVDYLGSDPGNIKIIPTGINTNIDILSPSERSEKRRILYMSRLDPIKGLDLLLPAFLKLSEKVNNIELVIAGPDFGMLEFVENFIRDNSEKAKISYVGTVTGPEKQKLLDSASTFVLTSYSEGFSVAVLEALNQGIPVVVSTESGMSDEILDYKAGLIADFNVESIFQALYTMVSDKDFIKTSSENAQKLVKEKFDENQIEIKLSQLFGFT